MLGYTLKNYAVMLFILLMVLLCAGCVPVSFTTEESLAYIKKARHKRLNRELMEKSVDRIIDADRMQAVPYCIDILFDSRQEQNVRSISAGVLGRLQCEEAFQALVAAVNHEDLSCFLKKSAGLALNRYEDDRVMFIFLDGIAAGGSDSGLFAGLLVERENSDQAVPRLIELLNEQQRKGPQKEHTASAAAWALGAIRDKRAVEPLMDAVREGSHRVRGTAVKALGKIGDNRCVDLLIEIAEENKWALSRDAVEALGEIGDPSAVPFLIDMVEDKNRFWSNAVRALGKIGDERAGSCLLMRLKDPSVKNSYNNWILRALYNVCGRDTEISKITKLCASSDHYTRENAALVLGRIGNPKAAEAVAPLIHDKHYHVRKAAINALGSLQSLVSVKALIDSISGSDNNSLLRLKCDALKKLECKDFSRLMPLLEKTTGCNECIIDLLSETLTKSDDPRYILPIARCHLSNMACRSIAYPSPDIKQFTHEESGRYLLNMSRQDPQRLKVLYNSEDTRMRILGMKALFFSGPEGIDILIDIIRHKKPGWQNAACMIIHGDTEKAKKISNTLLKTIEDEDVRGFLHTLINNKRLREKSHEQGHNTGKPSSEDD